MSKIDGVNAEITQAAVNETKENVGSRVGSKAQIKRMAEIRLLSEDRLIQDKIIYSGMKDRPLLNTFRELRTKLLQKSSGKNFICLVSSLSAGGGASYVALNMAAVFSLDQSKTSMLIDCNLYGRGVDSVFNLGSVDGVTDFVESPELEIKDIIYASGINRLRIVPVGSNREAGAEHYSSSRMQSFLSEIKNRYDDRFIFVDAPPIISAAESRILADLCDMAILVLPYGKVSQAQVEAGVEAIDQAKLAGIVFNN